MNTTSEKTPNKWSWKWTATFAVMLGYSVGATLWINGFQVPATLVGVASTLTGMYVISSK